MFLCFYVSVFIQFAVNANAQNNSVPENIIKILDKNISMKLTAYPLGFWNYTNLKMHGEHFTESEVKSWADAGFNLPQSPIYDPSDSKQKAQIEKMLKWANSYGIRLVLKDPRCEASPGKNGDWSNIRENYKEEAAAAIKDFAKYPALFGFHVGDEPDCNMKDSFFNYYRILKETGPNIPAFANLLPFFPGIESRAGTDTWPNYLDEYAKEANPDFFCWDCYAQMNPGKSGWHNYFENLRLNREASLRHGIPYWTTLLCVGHYNYRPPNIDELRWQFNTAIASGAQGIVWFHYYINTPLFNYRMAPVNEFWEKTQTYDDLKLIQNSFHKRYKNLFLNIVCTKTMFYPVAYGGGETFAPDNFVSSIKTDKPGHPVLISEFTDRKGNRYFMMVNMSMTENADVIITIPGNDVTLHSWNWDGKEYQGFSYCGEMIKKDDVGLTVHHWLAPGQETVYRIESEKISKEQISAK